jgi:hypothetical protein
MADQGGQRGAILGPRLSLQPIKKKCILGGYISISRPYYTIVF